MKSKGHPPRHIATTIFAGVLDPCRRKIIDDPESSTVLLHAFYEYALLWELCMDLQETSEWTARQICEEVLRRVPNTKWCTTSTSSTSIQADSESSPEECLLSLSNHLLELSGNFWPFANSFRNMCRNERRFFRTQQGNVGLAPRNTRPGDLIYFFRRKDAD